jgi:hypothetical protein
LESKPDTLTTKQIRESLLILLQHNCLTLINIDGGRITYNMCIDMVVNRLSFPKIVLSAKTLHGPVGELLMEELIFHGRLRFSQARSDVLERLKTYDTSVDGEESALSGLDVSDEKIQAVFESLVQCRLIVPVATRINTNTANSNNTSSSNDDNSADVKGSKKRKSAADETSINPPKKAASTATVQSEEIVFRVLPIELTKLQGMDQKSTEATESSRVASEPARRGRGGRGGRGRGRGRALARLGDVESDDVTDSTQVTYDLVL